MNILVTTMGASWQILPELLGYTNPGIVDLFQFHPERMKMEKDRQNSEIVPADEVWVISSCGRQSEVAIEQMRDWHQALDSLERPVLRIWKVAGTDALSTEKECLKMSEAIHTVVCHALERISGGSLMLSIAGGRKTMSTDMQQAAGWFGCASLIHVVDDQKKSSDIGTRSWGTNLFLKPFPKEAADVFTPFCLGRFPSYPLSGQINCRDYFLPLPEDVRPLMYHPPEAFPLTSKIREIKTNAGFLMSNYTNQMLQGEVVTNFLALYSLPGEIIHRLKQIKFGIDPAKESEEISILKRFPKSELHCHLGGVATADELIRIAEAAIPDIQAYQQELKPCLETWRQLIKTKDAGKIKKHIGDLKSVRTAVVGIPEAVCTAAFVLLFRDCPDLLHQVIYRPFLDDEKFCGITFNYYEKMGDLQGSGLLTLPGCLEAACHILAEKAMAHHVDYLEVRCSPVKYISSGQTGEAVCRRIAQVFIGYEDRLRVSLIFTASRHGEIQQVQEHVQLAEVLLQSGESWLEKVPLRGFDLAGDEKSANASDMQTHFLPMMKNCIHFTIHAGEIVPADSIWEAVYYLNAGRIGHGLTLKDHPALMEKILDRKIALEMCPSSNFQIVGFRDNYYPSTGDQDLYPLKYYLDRGISVTINTDNPGISDTDFTRELHRACRLTPGGLSLWEILSLIRNSFKASFAPRPLKYDILKKAEGKIVELLHEIL